MGSRDTVCVGLLYVYHIYHKCSRYFYAATLYRHHCSATYRVYTFVVLNGIRLFYTLYTLRCNLNIVIKA